jgi:hypothetical protein
MKILESFASTRREKYKRAAALKQRETDDIGKHFDKLKKTLTSARAKFVSIDQIKTDTEKMEAKDKEDNIVDTDWSTSEL